MFYFNLNEFATLPNRMSKLLYRALTMNTCLFVAKFCRRTGLRCILTLINDTFLICKLHLQSLENILYTSDFFILLPLSLLLTKSLLSKQLRSGPRFVYFLVVCQNPYFHKFLSII